MHFYGIRRKTNVYRVSCSSPFYFQQHIRKTQVVGKHPILVVEMRNIKKIEHDQLNVGAI